MRTNAMFTLARHAQRAETVLNMQFVRHLREDATFNSLRSDSAMANFLSPVINKNSIVGRSIHVGLYVS